MDAELVKAETLSVAKEEARKLRLGIRAAKSPADLQRLVREVGQALDNVFEIRLARSDHSVACKVGCHYCCHIKVDASPYEVFRIVERLRRKCTPAEVMEVQERARLNRSRISGMSAEEQLTSRVQCSLLKDGKCICYSERPFVCRKHHAQDVRGCEQIFQTPAVEHVLDDAIPEVALGLAAISIATQQVFAGEGYDSRPYDLSSALAEALGNPKCYRRWRDKKRAFPGSFVAKDWDPNDAFRLPI